MIYDSTAAKRSWVTLALISLFRYYPSLEVSTREKREDQNKGICFLVAIGFKGISFCF